MRKKALFSVILVGVSLGLTACGSSGGSHSMNSNYGLATAEAVMMDDYYYDYDYDYTGNTYISGDLASYSYTFSAEGDTKKTKGEMLAYFEELQELVNENEGYVQNVDNTYSRNVIDDDIMYLSPSEINYKAYGRLNFTVMIPNENAQLILDSLEEFCTDNKFDITAYNQRVENYVNYDIVPSYEDIDWADRDYTIKKSELERKLKYAEIRVNIYYHLPRSGVAKFFLRFESAWAEFWDDIGEVIVVFLALGFGLMICIFMVYLESTVLYKARKKMIYKHRNKKPEYYYPKEVVVINKEKEYNEDKQ